MQVIHEALPGNVEMPEVPIDGRTSTNQRSRARRRTFNPPGALMVWCPGRDGDALIRWRARLKTGEGGHCGGFYWREVRLRLFEGGDRSPDSGHRARQLREAVSVGWGRA